VRAVGVLFSPRATYAAVAARPAWVGMLLLVLVISSGVFGGFMATEVGQRTLIDQQITTMESWTGRQVTQDQLERLERIASYYGYGLPAIIAVQSIVIVLVVSGVLFAIFTAFLGGEASFKQVFAVVTHAGAVIALQQLFVVPLDYVRESISSPTTLAVFFPMLDDRGFVARLLGSIDLFFIWWIVSLSIGLGVVYRRRTGPIASGLLITYGVIALVIVAVRSALAGA